MHNPIGECTSDCRRIGCPKSEDTLFCVEPVCEAPQQENSVFCSDHEPVRKSFKEEKLDYLDSKQIEAYDGLYVVSLSEARFVLSQALDQQKAAILQLIQDNRATGSLAELSNSTLDNIAEAIINL